MKKLLTILILLLTVNIVSRADSEPIKIPLSLTELGDGWDSSYDSNTKTITFTGEWKGRGWWINSELYSNLCNKVVVQFNAPTTFKVRLQMVYIDANDTEQTIETTNENTTDTELSLNIPIDIKSIKKIDLRNYDNNSSVSDQLVLIDAFLEAPFLEEGISKTLYNEETELTDWPMIAKRSGSLAPILEVNNQLFVTISAISGENSKIAFRDNNYGYITDISVNDISEFPYIAKIRITDEIVSGTTNYSLSNGFHISGEGVTITKIELYKPNVYTLTKSATNGSIAVLQGQTDVTGTSNFEEGTDLTLTATPSPGYRFLNWTNGNESPTANPLGITISENTTISANFQDKKILSWNDEYETGAISDLRKGDHIQITFTSESALSNNDVQVWYKDASNSYSGTRVSDGTWSNNVYEFVLTETSASQIQTSGLYLKGQNATFSSVEIVKYYDVTITTPTNGSISVKNGVAEVTTGTSVPVNTSLTLTAEGITGYEFYNWTSPASLSSDGASTNLAVTGDVTITALFGLLRTPKDLSTGSQKIRAHSSVAIPKGMFDEAAVGDVLTINVSNIAGGAKYTLKGWNQDTRSEGNKNWSSFLEEVLATNATSITCTLNADRLNIIQNAGLSIEGNGFTCGNVTLSTAGAVGTAQNHTNPTFALTVNAAGGTVAVYQENGTTPATGGSYEIETNLVLKATPNPDFVFVKWTEGTTDLAANEDKSLSITMDNNREITAVFSTNPLEYEDERTLFEGSVDINWDGVAIQPSTVGAILEAGEQLILTTTVAEGAYGQVAIRGADRTNAIEGSAIGGLVNGENVITLTSAMVEAMREEFGFWGKDATLTKVVLYKPDVIFVDGEANLDRGVEDGGKTTFTAQHDEAITGNVLVVESNENATVKVTFSDNTTATNKPGDRKIGNPTGSQALVLLDRSKFIKTIEIDKAKDAITKIYMSSLTLFEKSGEDYIADLSLAKAMDNTTFDTSSYTIATTVAWSGGIQLDVLEGETVKGKELMIQTESDADLKVTVEYESGDKTEVQDRPASKEMKVVIDGNRAVKQILIQPKTASVTKLLKVAVNASATPDPNVFSKDDKGNFVADLSMVKAEGATYNNTTFTMVATDNWQGVTVTPGNAEVVKGKELYIEFDKAALGYAKISYVDDETSVEGGLDAAGTVMKIALDDSKQISKIEIKLKEAGTAKFKKIAVNATETADESGDDDEEAIIDEKTGETDLNELSAQDDTKTTLTQNEDGSITMTTTEAYCAAQIWFNDPETVAGNVLKVELAESSVNVTVTVKYTDGTESQMSANTKAVVSARATTRAVASGTTIEVPLETGKEVQNIEVKNNEAGTITIKKMQVTTVNVFTNGVANLSMLKPQSNATYDTAAHTLATTKGWTGATISPVAGENVSGKELLIEFADASKVKVAVKYRTDVEGPSKIMDKAAKSVRLALDNTKNIQEISIQPTEAAIVTFTKIAVNSEESDDGSLKPGKTITLWESATGETLAWNEVAKQDASVGEMLKEYDELLITVSGVTEGCDWPKVFIRDASSEQAGNEVLLNDIGSFPYTVRIVLTGEMAQQLQKGFSICGDGVTVKKLQVYRPEAPKTGDIHLADLNYGYNSSYDKGSHTITTTARWAARGWEIGDKRYNDKNLITVKFEAVDFPVTLKMEYTTGLQTAQATSVGVPAGRTELLLEIPKGISKLNRVYIIYENPGSVKLTEASVTYMENLKLSTAIQAFEADGVIRGTLRHRRLV